MAGRYRRVRPRMWLERAFTGLNDGEKLVVFYLLSGPATTATGVCRVPPGAAAEALGWPTRTFQQRLATVVRAFGWRYDATEHVLWMPEWFAANPPANPNVVKSWRAAFDEIPDCPVKAEAWAAVRAFLAPRGDAFLAPFDELVANSLGNGFANGLANPPVPVSEGLSRRARLSDAERVRAGQQTARMVETLRRRAVGGG